MITVQLSWTLSAAQSTQLGGPSWLDWVSSVQRQHPSSRGYFLIDLRSICIVLEAVGSQLIALLFRIVATAFLYSVQIIPNSLSSTTFSIVLDTQLHQFDSSFVLLTCRCPLYKLWMNEFADFILLHLSITLEKFLILGTEMIYFGT